jgi:hypothetical protein
MQKAYVVLNRPSAAVGHNFTLYVAMAATKEAAISAVRLLPEVSGQLEINGLPVSDATVTALGLGPNEVRRL